MEFDNDLSNLCPFKLNKECFRIPKATFNPIALRKAKIAYKFNLSANRVKLDGMVISNG